MTTKEMENLARGVAEYFHKNKDYTFFEYDNTEEDVARRTEQLKHDLTDIEAINEVIFDITDCNKNFDDSYSDEASALLKLLHEQRRFLENNLDKIMVGETNYEIKHTIHVGDKKIVFAEDKNAENGMCWFVGNYTSNELFGQYTDIQTSDDYLDVMQEFTGRVNAQIETMRSEIDQSKAPCKVFTAEHCYPNDRGQSIEDKIVAIKADILRPEYRRGDVQLVLVSGGSGARANSFGNAVFCYHLNDGQHTRFERYDVQGEVKPEFLPKWAKEKAVAIQAEKSAAQPQRKPKDREER